MRLRLLHPLARPFPETYLENTVCECVLTSINESSRTERRVGKSESPEFNIFMGFVSRKIRENLNLTFRDDAVVARFSVFPALNQCIGVSKNRWLSVCAAFTVQLSGEANFVDSVGAQAEYFLLKIEPSVVH